MQIVWDPKVIEQLRKSQTVLELETFIVEHNSITAYCVVPAEKILNEMSDINRYIELHEGFVAALKEKNHKLCQDIAEHLLGRFGGELDSFYQEILSRNQNA
jgi:hypothetical protein